MKKQELLSVTDFPLGNFEKIKEWKDNIGIYIEKKLYKERFNTPIYRYLSLPHLVEMIQERELFIPNRQKFSDLREHSDFCIKTIDELRNRLEVVPSHRERTKYREQKKIANQIWNQAISCWTYDMHLKDSSNNTLDENYLMWKANINKQYVCRVCSTLNDFVNSVELTSHNIIISDIEYYSLTKPLITHQVGNIFKKPDFYKGEQEVRLVALHNKVEDLNNKSDIIIKINPQIFIKSIKTSPFITPKEEVIIKKILNEALENFDIPVYSSMIMEYQK